MAGPMVGPWPGALGEGQGWGGGGVGAAHSFWHLSKFLKGGAVRNSQYFMGCLGRYYGCPTAVMALPWYVLVTVPYVYGACACPVSKASLTRLEREDERWVACSLFCLCSCGGVTIGGLLCSDCSHYGASGAAG